MFVWALTSAVAFTAYSSRPQNSSTAGKLVPVGSEKTGNEKVGSAKMDGEKSAPQTAASSVSVT